MYIPFIFVGLGLINILFFLFIRDKYSSPLAIIAKTTASLLFVITGIASFIRTYQKSTLDVNQVLMMMLFIFGLCSGVIGDIFLDLRVYLKSLYKKRELAEDKTSFVTTFGIAMFGVGHLCYLGALVIFAPEHAIYLLYSFLIAAAIMVTNQIVSVKVFKNDYHHHDVICTIYGSILATLLIYVIFLFCLTPFNVGLLILLIAAAFFSVSDYLLSIMYFSPAYKYDLPGRKNPECRFNIIFNHATYYIAQFMIAICLLFLL